MDDRAGDLVSDGMISDRTEEERRLIAQSQLFNPMTEPLLREAGIGPGMHVVDLGPGAGDLCLLIAETRRVDRLRSGRRAVGRCDRSGTASGG